MDEDDLPSAQQALTDGQRTLRIGRDGAAGIADDVSVAFGKPEHLGGVESRVHARHDGDLARAGRRERGCGPREPSAA